MLKGRCFTSWGHFICNHLYFMEKTFKKLTLVTPQGQGRLEGIRSDYRKWIQKEIEHEVLLDGCSAGVLLWWQRR